MLSALLFLQQGAVASAAGVGVSTPRFGNIFAPGEPVTIDVAADAPVAWAVRDLFGATVDSGSATPADGHAQLSLSLHRQGWFDVSVSAAGGGTAHTHIAVLPEPDDKMPNLRFGVMTHFAQGWPVDIAPLVARAGIGQVRDELYWQEVEKSPGQFALPDRYRRYLAALDANHLKLLLVVSFANKLYDDGQTPYSDEGQAAFARYARTMVTELKPRLSGVEVWNEINGSFCKGPCEKDRAGTYARLLAATYKAVKPVAPDLTIAGGAAVLVPQPWFQALFDHGALASMDAVVVHPYRVHPEGVETPLRALAALIKEKNGGRAKPIWATEFSTKGDGAHVARYLVEHATITLGEGVQRIYWYLMRDYANFDTMGLVAAPDSPLGRYAPAPAYAAYAVLIRQLGAATPDGRERTDPRTRLYRFTRPGDEVRVAWSSEGTAHLALAAPGPLEIVDMMGNASSRAPRNGSVELEVGENPVYIHGRVTGVREVGREPLLADSILNYTDGPEPDGAWSYGAYVCPAPADQGDCLAGYDPDALQPLAWLPDAWAYAWRAPGYRDLVVGTDNAHPAVHDGHQVWAVRRWTAKRADKLDLAGLARRVAGKGDGTVALILLDGKPIWQQRLGAAGAPDEKHFAVSAEVHPGSRLDFVVTPGPGTDLVDDSTEFSVRISDATSPPRN
jgi:hypothetical protein